MHFPLVLTGAAIMRHATFTPKLSTVSPSIKLKVNLWLMLSGTLWGTLWHFYMPPPKIRLI